MFKEGDQRRRKGRSRLVYAAATTGRRRWRQATAAAIAPSDDASIVLGIRARWDLVPHTGIAASLRWSPTEYGCYGGLRPAPMGSDPLEGTIEGTAWTRN